MRRVARDLIYLALGALVFSGLEALGQLIIYGHVRW